MGERYRQSCPACASPALVADSNEARHRRRAAELFAESRQAFDDAQEERRLASGEGQHKHNGCSRESHLEEAAESERAMRELSDLGDHELVLAGEAVGARFLAHRRGVCSLCGGTGTVRGNDSARIGGNARGTNNNVGR